jgi:methylmalonyl-CoA decarboxylase subunit alpha
MQFENELAEFEARRAKALAMGGERKLAERKEQGILNARERIAALADPATFLEAGLFAVAKMPQVRDKSPADGKITGFAKVDGREVAIVSNDFTVMGASSSTVNASKVGHVKKVATARGLPMVFLGESTGARMPDVMGAASITGGNRPTQYLRMRETPWVSAVLGHCYGSSSWYAALADFCVMRKGAITAVSSVKLTSMAISERVDPEDLGGWKMHSEVTGMIDLAVDTDEEALAAVRRFLSYLPSHHQEAPPVHPVPPASGREAHRILDILPKSRTKVYDVRKILELIYDAGSLFELKPRFGRSVVTALARLDGKSVGVIANNPFVIGVEGERAGAIGHVMNWMNALSLVTVPKISVSMRKSYGQAVLNMGGSGNADAVVAWFTAELNFMDPRHAVTIVHGVTEQDDPERYQALLEEMTRDTTAYDAAAAATIQAVINPVDTRDTLIRLLDVHRLRMTDGIGQHLMRTWPTSH